MLSMIFSGMISIYKMPVHMTTIYVKEQGLHEKENIFKKKNKLQEAWTNSAKLIYPLLVILNKEVKQLKRKNTLIKSQL